MNRTEIFPIALRLAVPPRKRNLCCRKRWCSNHNYIPKQEELPLSSRLEVLIGANAYACSLADEVSSEEEVVNKSSKGKESTVVGLKSKGKPRFSFRFMTHKEEPSCISVAKNKHNVSFEV
ncbi:hypothetical protein DVH24_027225 [Malus domestica]|uniref:Uncharacterized protein n=1 Tax=Malus domestica TaxID=3750 RepID=A0A498ILV5_MALDO|nr:hypothetical protein DVH24_027225 [Malus domestica]